MQTEYRQAIAQHRQKVYSFAHYSLRAKEDAEDVTQEVFIKLWQHWQKIDHNKIGGWLMRVAHNAVIDHVRKQRPSQNNVDQYAEVEEQVGSESDEGNIDQEVFKARLQEAIKSLDDPFRSILIMRDVQGLSYTDIQSSLDISESQVKVYLHRGRRKLRENESLRNMFEQQFGNSKSQSSLSNDQERFNRELNVTGKSNDK
ncbi:MAG: sigma-70 family RNA polymerase sigma factor [Gammaproteobacteria bacterium]|jgi:RNA polymerase sigma-70 factor (ECF subfamily)|nr:sigma-70 family RNA polymerase sigma factor [Gammaproteobacteria bacterium]MBT3860025.1 sigma-70 family RNA polymerase sigma factor [Gammaproteobacteria bacterium]MBT3987025.1 sigma-70 family RNA polymerase sigma factor [Gammaproteobacteria bacterium]MBT4256753.1 sigma-70 family RNA polymerase sigma factor [Gammaproteobacteria bacterium]MBT4580710.1 sigma-70 family RNA polymerase sigma factor [Gammaproteobacteria bacterium]